MKWNKIKNRWLHSEYIMFAMRMVAILMITLFVLTTFVFRTIYIDGSSMEPTLHHGEMGVANRLMKEQDLKRFDVIVMNTESEGYVVKRIVGLPNETIAYQDEKLLINGEWYDESFLDKDYIALHTMNNQIPFTQDFGPITLKDDEYFVVGDNRMNSKDSRVLGPIHWADIIARDVIVLFPLNEIRIESSK